MSLADTQAAFFALVTQPQTIRRGRALELFSGTPELPADERVRIYANMYLWRLVDALRNEFPKLAAALGDEYFLALMEKYLRRHPSEHPDVGLVGRRLVRFLREHPDSNRRADLADLAELEQVRSQVFLEADAEPIEASAIAALGPINFARARLRLVPALQLRHFEYEVALLWRSLDDEQPPPPPQRSPNEVAIWRKGFSVFHVVLTMEEAEALRRAMQGAPLEEVCAVYSHHDLPVQAAFAALSSWFGESWVAALETD